MKRKKQLNSEKGITMMTLVVTIIVMLILAGVAINLGARNNSLVSNSRKASEQSKREQAITEAKLKIMEWQRGQVLRDDNYILEKELADILSEVDLVTEIQTDTSGDVTGITIETGETIPIAEIYDYGNESPLGDEDRRRVRNFNY